MFLLAQRGVPGLVYTATLIVLSPMFCADFFITCEFERKMNLVVKGFDSSKRIGIKLKRSFFS